MIPLEEAVTARLESHGERFEVLVDPDAALEIKRGEIQITAEQRREMQEQKHKNLVNRITRNAVNPQMDNAPHPPERIESALEETDFRVDPMEPVETQVDDALDALRPVIPIRFDEVTVAVQVPADYAGSAQAKIRQFGELEREEWQNDGGWVGVLTFPAGMQNDFYDLVNEHTSGEAETQIIKDEDELNTR